MAIGAGDEGECNDGTPYTILYRIRKDKWRVYIEGCGEAGASRKAISTDNVVNVYAKKVHGVGYYGEYYRCKDTPLLVIAKKKWRDLLLRCYSPKSLLIDTTYIGCTVAEDWHYFGNFYEWFLTNYREGFDLDKDIYSSGGERMYSKETCVFIPQAINKLYTLRGNDRGESPVGVKRYCEGGFVARCSNNGVFSTVGTAKTEVQAYILYCNAKINVIRGKLSEHLVLGDISTKTYNMGLIHGLHLLVEEYEKFYQCSNKMEILELKLLVLSSLIEEKICKS